MTARNRHSSAPRRAYRVGDRVRFTFGFEEVEGIVEEDRGPLGPDGEQIYRVRLERDYAEPMIFELLVSQLQPADATHPGRQPTGNEPT
jgi:hypothetical protein